MLRENRARERFPKAPKTFRAWKTYRKTPTCIFCKVDLFIFCIKEIKIKTTAKFRTSRRLRSEDKRRIMSPEKFWDFRETGKATGKTTGRQATSRPLMIYIFLTRVPTNLTKGLRFKRQLRSFYGSNLISINSFYAGFSPFFLKKN